MVVGNISIIYQKELKDATEKRRKVKKFGGVKIDRRISQKLGLPYEILRSRPGRDFFGVEIINCGPAPPVPFNFSEKRSAANLTGVGLADCSIRQIVLGLKIDEFSACWTY
jgi:hypothetical protein